MQNYHPEVERMQKIARGVVSTLVPKGKLDPATEALLVCMCEAERCKCPGFWFEIMPVSAAMEIFADMKQQVPDGADVTMTAPFELIDTKRDDQILITCMYKPPRGEAILMTGLVGRDELQAEAQELMDRLKQAGGFFSTKKYERDERSFHE